MFELHTERDIRHFSEQKPNVISAAVQSEQVTDANETPQLLSGLDCVTWLPYAAKLYHISPRIEDYILVVTPICPSDIPNRNGIGFPLNELTRFQEPPVARMAYKTWSGCPVHYEHANEDHTKAYGVILDTSLHKVSGYGQGKLWKVMGLLAIDRLKYPKMAERILHNEVNTYSMGALVDSFSCSHCGEPMSEKSYCQHLNPRNEIDWQALPNYRGPTSLAFRNSHGIQGIETSIVESPAWSTALSDHILTR
jgi:hypothetical protein